MNSKTECENNRSASGKPQFVELFCGIGGFAESVRELATVRTAIDISLNALKVYRLNFSHPTKCRTIESLSMAETAEWRDKSWWLSPPCQPFTARGKSADIGDARCKAFLNVVSLIEAHRPPEIGIENVPEFQHSQAHAMLQIALDRNGYFSQEIVLCPTQFENRNRRSRFYLIAGLEPVVPWRELQPADRETSVSTEHPDMRQLEIDAAQQLAYQVALDVVEENRSRNTACFTSAYGRSIVRSGSYLRTSTGIRRFSPREVLDQLGFSRQFRLPDWPYKKLWTLVGNSLSIPVVRYVVSHLPSMTKSDANQ